MQQGGGDGGDGGAGEEGEAETPTLAELNREYEGTFPGLRYV